MNFFRRFIDIPEKLQTALLGALLFLMVQLELWLSSVLGIDLTGVFTPIAAVVAMALTIFAKMLLERFVPESQHPTVNAFLVWLAGFFAARAMLVALM